MTDETILKLSDYEHIRRKTEMYFGSRNIHTQNILHYDDDGNPYFKETSWVPAVYTAFREVLDNALDELSLGHGNRIDVTYDEEKSQFSVQDNGRGIPIDWSDEHAQHLATLVLSEPRSGRNFEIRKEVAGTNGIGASATNFCSEWLKLEVWRNKQSFMQRFKESNEELVAADPTIKKIKTDRSGTKISFQLSKEVFQDLTLPTDFLYSRIYEVALANPMIRMYWNGQRIKVKPTAEKTLFPNEKPIVIDIKEKGFRSKFILKPSFLESGEETYTIVNNIPAFNGGVHIETFRRVFYSGLLDALSRESKRRKLTPNRSDVNDGLFIFNITSMNAPNFDSQSKTRLINEEVGKTIKSHLEDEKLFKSIISKNSDWIDEIYTRCENRTQKKEAAEIGKAARKLMRGKVPSLKDATGKDRSKCILFLAEGESAIAGMNNVRNSEIHGGLGLRGKVLNVNGESPKKVLDNQSLANIMNSLGLIIGEEAKREDLRYGKVYIAHDMDQDGYNIGALLINFFYTFWPELFDPEQEPVFYIFNTPFIIAKKGKERKYWYGTDYHTFDPEDYKGWNITRAKGLGTLMSVDWEHALANPNVYPIIDDGNMAEALDLIFNGSRADDRKNWIGLTYDN